MAVDEHQSFLAETSRALARLDADRLEAMALKCKTLRRGCPSVDSVCEALAVNPRQAAQEMAVLAAVIEATRGNRNVLRRVSKARLAIDYGYGPGGQWKAMGMRHGND